MCWQEYLEMGHFSSIISGSINEYNQLEKYFGIA